MGSWPTGCSSSFTNWADGEPDNTPPVGAPVSDDTDCVTFGINEWSSNDGREPNQWSEYTCGDPGEQGVCVCEADAADLIPNGLTDHHPQTGGTVSGVAAGYDPWYTYHVSESECTADSIDVSSGNLAARLAAYLVGIIVGLVIFACCVTAGCFWCYYRRKSMETQEWQDYRDNQAGVDGREPQMVTGRPVVGVALQPMTTSTTHDPVEPIEPAAHIMAPVASGEMVSVLSSPVEGSLVGGPS